MPCTTDMDSHMPCTTDMDSHMPCTTDMDSYMTCTNSYITAWASTMTPYIHVSWSILMLLYHYCAHYGA